MTAFLEVDHVDRVFPLPNGDHYVALRNIHLTVRQGEFVSLLGHSGCGKSTLLNIMAGLDRASQGGVLLEGREVRRPGPDRMVVFQNYSLLPWRTVRQNIALAVDRVFSQHAKAEREEMVEHHIQMVGLRQAADKRPHELSGGMKQRVAIARALAIRPKVLLLDEPFGALDALTRGNLQEQLMGICQENQVTAIMVTHDVDEALFLSDRIVMLTNGPNAHIGQILEVPISRPRKRLEMVNHPSYYSLRSEIIDFLNQQKQLKRRKMTAPTIIARNGLEKVNLELGFIPLSDCAPLVVAQEKGFFKQYGLEEVKLSRESSWKGITEGVLSGRLDAAQMVTGMPLAMTMGLGHAPAPVITPLVLSRNGNAITLDRHFYDQGVKSLADFKAYLDRTPENRHTLGMVHPASMHNLLLRYWLASGGIDPDQDVTVMRLPPAQMVSNLKAGNIDGYCVGEPWNSRAVYEGLGVVMATDLDLWPGHPEKVLGLQEAWVNAYPNTATALVKALLKACEYCDDYRNREEILQWLCQPEYVGSLPEYTRPGWLDPYSLGTDAAPQSLLRFNQFYVDQANYPNPDEGLWILTQLARWDLAPMPKNRVELLERVYRVDLFERAAEQLGHPVMAPNRQPFALFDGVYFDPDDPLSYLQKFSIRREFRVESVPLTTALSGVA
jgi:nitrate/nitrite transport system ATP-binding protein